jgi:hypothetical protein
MQRIKVGRGPFQNVKQPLQATRAFIANGKNCATHNIIDVVVHRTVDGPVSAALLTRRGWPFYPERIFQ